MQVARRRTFCLCIGAGAAAATATPSGASDLPKGKVPAFVLQLRQEKANGAWPALDEGKVRLRLEDRTMLVARGRYVEKEVRPEVDTPFHP